MFNLNLDASSIGRLKGSELVENNHKNEDVPERAHHLAWRRVRSWGYNG